MTAPHTSFVSEMLGKLGAPIFAGTLVGCILREEVTVSHVVLLVVGLALLVFAHWRDFHRAA